MLVFFSGKYFRDSRIWSFNQERLQMYSRVYLQDFPINIAFLGVLQNWTGPKDCRWNKRSEDKPSNLKKINRLVHRNNNQWMLPSEKMSSMRTGLTYVQSPALLLFVPLLNSIWTSPGIYHIGVRETKGSGADFGPTRGGWIILIRHIKIDVYRPCLMVLQLLAGKAHWAP